MRLGRREMRRAVRPVPALAVPCPRLATRIWRGRWCGPCVWVSARADAGGGGRGGGGGGFGEIGGQGNGRCVDAGSRSEFGRSTPSRDPEGTGGGGHAGGGA